MRGQRGEDASLDFSAGEGAGVLEGVAREDVRSRISGRRMSTIVMRPSAITAPSTRNTFTNVRPAIRFMPSPRPVGRRAVNPSIDLASRRLARVRLRPNRQMEHGEMETREGARMSTETRNTTIEGHRYQASIGRDDRVTIVIDEGRRIAKGFWRDDHIVELDTELPVDAVEILEDSLKG